MFVPLTLTLSVANMVESVMTATFRSETYAGKSCRDKSWDNTRGKKALSREENGV